MLLFHFCCAQEIVSPEKNLVSVRTPVAISIRERYHVSSVHTEQDPHLQVWRTVLREDSHVPFQKRKWYSGDCCL